MAEIAAGHEQHAMGEVQHLHDAEDQHHAERHQHIDAADHRAVDDLLEQRRQHDGLARSVGAGAGDQPPPQSALY